MSYIEQVAQFLVPIRLRRGIQACKLAVSPDSVLESFQFRIGGTVVDQVVAAALDCPFVLQGHAGPGVGDVTHGVPLGYGCLLDHAETDHSFPTEQPPRGCLLCYNHSIIMRRCYYRTHFSLCSAAREEGMCCSQATS